PAYEFALILDTDLRRRKLRHKVPITFVTSEPYIGHLGLGGVGDSKGLLEREFRQHDIKWITNAKVDAVEPDRVRVTVHDDGGGAAAIEFAIVGPFFLLLVVGMIVYGGWLWMAHSVQAAVSE